MISLFILFLFPNFSEAGIGGIAGGGHILFQEDSTFVSPVYSRSLCHDRSQFKAEVSVCVKTRRNSNDNEECVEYAKKDIQQPMISTRERCDVYEQDKCVHWITVPFNQSPVRKVEFFEDEDMHRKIGEKMIAIPVCN